MKIAICDDHAGDLDSIATLVARYDPEIAVSLFSSALALYESGEDFDAVLLDIEMEAPNGYEIALRMARQAHHPIILFVTNSAAYAVQGYGLALRYLLKPLSPAAIAEALDAVRQELRQSRLTVTLDGIAHVLKVQDIRFVEVLGHRITLHTTDGTVSFRASLRDILSQLPERWFSMPHQSYVVNLLHVRSASKVEVTLTDGTKIPVSRRRQQEFTHSFHRFLGV